MHQHVQLIVVGFLGHVAASDCLDLSAFHARYAIAVPLGQLEVELAGYVCYQCTGDSGSGARLGPFESRVAAIGPEVGYAFKVGRLPAYANLRAYYAWAQNRVSDYAAFATLGLPLGK